MNLKHPIFLSLALLLFTTFAGAQSNLQDFDPGRPSDLKGLSKVYIETLGDLKEYERIEERLKKKAVPGLAIVEDLVEAEIILFFGGSSFEKVFGATANQVGDSVYATTNRVELLAGEGRVFVVPPGAAKPRLALRVQNQQGTKWEKRPVTKFIDEFVRAYKKVNAIEQMK